MDSRRLGLRGLIAVLTFAATTVVTLHARANAPRQDPQATGTSQSGAVLVDRYAQFFQKVAETGSAGYNTIQPAFSELMLLARQSLADHRIDQPFFDRYARLLRVTLLASIPDQAEILQPITSREFSSFVRDVTGRNVDASASIGLGELSSALATEVTNLKKIASGVPGGIPGGVTGGIVGGAPAPSAPVRVGGDIKPPERTKYVAPVYPRDAMAAKVQGTVIVQATIGKDGHVVQAKVLKPAPMLDEAALAAVKQWEYAPTMLGGVPVEVIMTVTVSFNLK